MTQVDEKEILNYIASLSAPILLTGPHTANLNRGGKATGIPVKKHLREMWVSTIVLMLADALQETSSFVIWSRQ